MNFGFIAFVAYWLCYAAHSFIWVFLCIITEKIVDSSTFQGW